MSEGRSRTLREQEEDVLLCRRYFFAGLAALPLLWVFNAISFWKKSREPRASELRFCRLRMMYLN